MPYTCLTCLALASPALLSASSFSASDNFSCVLWALPRVACAACVHRSAFGILLLFPMQQEMQSIALVNDHPHTIERLHRVVRKILLARSLIPLAFCCHCGAMLTFHASIALAGVHPHPIRMSPTRPTRPSNHIHKFGFRKYTRRSQTITFKLSDAGNAYLPAAGAGTTSASWFAGDAIGGKWGHQLATVGCDRSGMQRTHITEACESSSNG